MNEAVHVLRELQISGFDEAIIAGGAVRDSFLGKRINDIDIFIQYPHAMFEDFDDLEKDGWCRFLNTLDVKLYEEFSEDTVDPDYTRDDVFGVFSARSSDFDYQIIIVEQKPIDFVKECFDIGLCKCWHDGERARFTGEFLQDEQDHTLTICPTKMSESEYNHTIKHHIPNMKWKYPYHIVVAPHIQYLADKYGTS